MISEYYPKITKGLLAITVFVVVFLPEVVIEVFAEISHLVFELLTELAHLLLEGLDIAFEGVEASLDQVVEGMFETDVHNTQIIVFYIIISPILYLLYRLAKRIPRWLLGLKDKLLASVERRKIRTIIYWQNLNTLGKAKIIGMASFVVLYYAFIVF